MRKLALLWLSMFCVSPTIIAANPYQQPKVFMENSGQFAAETRFVSHQNNFRIGLSAKGLHYHFETTTGQYRMDLLLVGANKKPILTGEQPQTYFENHLVNNQSTLAKSYRTVVYKDVYKGIDWHVFYSETGDFKHEFHVAAGADPSQIRLKYQGHNQLLIDQQGGLTIQTTHGHIREKAPQSWDQSGIPIHSAFHLGKDGLLTFKLGHYDNTQPIVIDPLVNWATYIGGNGNNDVVTDMFIHQTSGNVYLAGHTNSSDFASNGLQQNTNNGVVGFLAAYTAAGVKLWASYIGETDTTQVLGITGTQNSVLPTLYIAGRTNSTASIATPGTHQQQLAGGFDGFAARFDSAGGRIWGTYYGGALDDRANSISHSQIDNRIMVAGSTFSTDGIATILTLRTSKSANDGEDGFIVGLSITGQRQVATYIGGPQTDRINKIIYGVNNIFIGGYVSGSSPYLGGTFGGGISDGFIMRINVNLNFAPFSAYIGGNGNDEVTNLSLDGENLYVVGNTSSTDRIATNGAPQGTRAGLGLMEGFVMRYGTVGTKFWGTYLGGQGNDYLLSTAAAPNNGGVLVGGYSTSDSILAVGGFQNRLNGIQNGIVGRYTHAGQRSYTSFYGNNHLAINAIGFNPNNNLVYIGGSTTDTNIASIGANRASPQGRDGFLATIAEPVFSIIGPAPGNATYCPLNPFSYRIYLGSGFQIGDSVVVDMIANTGLAYRIDTLVFQQVDTITRTRNINIPQQASYGRLRPTILKGNQEGATWPGSNPFSGVVLSSPVLINAQPAQPNNPLCEGSNFTLTFTATFSSGYSYQWLKNGQLIPNATSNSLVLNNLSLADSGVYQGIVNASCGSDTTNSITIRLSPATTIQNLPVIAPQCLGNNYTFTATATGENLSYQWRKNGQNIIGATDSTLQLTNITANDFGFYNVQVASTACSVVSSNTVELRQLIPNTFGAAPSNALICTGSSYTARISTNQTGNLQWFKNNQPIPNATADSINFTSITLADSGIYQLRAFGCDTTYASNTFRIEVKDEIDLQSGLKVYLPFNGDVVERISDRALTGGNFTNFLFDRNGYATGTLNFNGVPFVLDSTPLPSGNEPFTLTFWLRPNASTTQGVVRWTWGSGTNYTFVGILNGYGLYVLYGGMSYQAQQTGTLSTWSHYAVSYDGSDLRLYRNGTLLQTNSLQFAGTTAATSQLSISATAPGASNLNAALDEVRIYDRSLHPTEIQQLFAAPEVRYTQTQIANCIGSQIEINATIAPPSTNAQLQWYKDEQPIPGATQAQLSITGDGQSDGQYQLKVGTGTCGVVAYEKVLVTSDNSANYLERYYPLNGNLVDSSGNNGDNLFFTSTTNPPPPAVFTHDRFGNNQAALSINNLNQQIALQLSAGPKTYAFWHRYDGRGNNLGPANVLFSNNASANVELLGIYNDRLFFFNYIGLARTYTPVNQGAPFLEIGKWYHITVTYVGTVMTVYLNGNFYGSRSEMPNSYINPIVRMANGGNFTEAAFGAFDDVRFYNRVIDPASIRALANQRQLGPLSQTVDVCLGQNTTLRNADQLFPIQNYTFQWFKNGQLLPSATADSLNLNQIAMTDSGTYRLDYTAACGLIRSLFYEVRVSNGIAITTQPQNQSSCQNSVLTIRIGITGPAPDSIQWFRNGQLLATGFSDSLTVNTTQIANSGMYFGRIFSKCGTLQSDSFNIQILPQAFVTNQPTTLPFYCTGAGLNLHAQSSDTSASLQWFKNGIPISGANTTNFSISSLSLADSGRYHAQINGICINTNTDTVTVTVFEPTRFSGTILGGNASFCAGSQATLMQALLGSASNAHFTWYKNGVSLPAFTTRTLTIDSFTVADTGSYSLRMITPCDTTFSDTVFLGILPRLVLLQQPTAMNVYCVGRPLSLSLRAQNASIQWYKNGQLIGNANDSTFSISSLDMNDAGAYFALLSNSCGTLSTDTLQINLVNPPTLSGPIMGGNGAFCSGSQVSLLQAIQGSVANGSFTWFKNGTALLGTTTRTLTIPSFTASDTGQYVLRMITACDTSFSDTVRLSLAPNPQITLQPIAATSYCTGQNAQFRIGALHGSIQWFKDGQLLPNANDSILSLTNLSNLQQGSYFATVTNGCGVINSDTIQLNLLAAPVLLSQMGGGGSFCAGSTWNSGIISVSNPNNGSYQWFRNGIALPTFTNRMFQLNNFSANDTGTYILRIASACDTFFTQPIQFSLLPSTQIIQQPTAPASLCAGASTVLRLNAAGLNLNYQWQFNGTNVLGANVDSLVISNFSNSAAGQYRCIVTGDCGQDTSFLLNIGIITAPNIVVQPNSATSCTGDTATFAVTANGTLPLQYTWVVNGVPFPPTNINSLQLPTPLSGSFSYYVIVSNACGNDTSATTSYTVQPTVNSSLTASICSGDNFLFNGQSLSIAGNYQSTLTSASGCDSTVNLQLVVRDLPQPIITQSGFNLATDSFATYQWILDGNEIPGAITRQLNAQANGQYQVRVNDTANCEGISAIFNLTGVSVSELNSSNPLIIYPNPAKSQLTVESKNHQKAILRNSLGQEIRVIWLEAGLNNLSLYELADGVYYLECDQKTHRIVKQH